MAADTPLSLDADTIHGGASRAPLLDRLNRTVDRLFGFELQAEELRALAHTRKVVESVPAPHARQTLSGWRLRQGSGQGR